MKILAFETSAKSVSVAAVEDGTVLASASLCTGLTHSRTLAPMMDALLRNAELPLSSIDVFAVAAGPGSFTGIRIGVAAVKGLAWAQEKPCAAVSTLYAMAVGAPCGEAELICAMDARRNQIYSARFLRENGELLRLSSDCAIGLDELTDTLQKEPPRRRVVVGDGAPLCAVWLQEHGISCSLAPPPLSPQNAVGVALAAEEMARRGELCTAQTLRPVYLRASQAERERAEREAMQ